MGKGTFGQQPAETCRFTDPTTDKRKKLDYPPALNPTSTENLQITEYRVVSVSKATPVFEPWRGSPVTATYGGKTILDFGGEPLFAELVILRHFESSGWQGVWVDTYRNRTLVSCDRETLIPPKQRSWLDRIATQAKNKSGCFDVFAWRDDLIAFAEAKRAGRDRIRSTQIRWLEAALAVGVPLKAFLVVEWSLARAAE